MALTVLLLPMVLIGCSAPAIPKTDVEKGVYAKDDLGRFVEDTSTLPRRVVEPEYMIGVGDRLDVVFLFHANLSTRDLMVRTDGRISLPYVGDQMAAGLTPMLLDSVLTAGFSDILRQPNISVIVRQAAEQKVYVMGEVQRPGGYEFDDQVSMLQSIASAGGLLKSADAEHTVLIRRDGYSKILGVEIDVAGILAGAELQNDVHLRNYDIVYVPKRPIYDAAEFVEVVTDMLLGPVMVVFRGWEIATLSAHYEFLQRSLASPGVVNP
jgi:polysaccharide export outer membrane protein